MDIITSHLNADFDAFASMVAAKKLYPEAELVFPGSQEKKLRDFIAAFNPIRVKRLKEVDLDKVKRLIVVDTRSAGRIGRFAEILHRDALKVHVYDHHRHEAGDIRGQLEVIEKVGATATIMAETLRSQKLHPAPIEATVMALGIYEETGGLLFPTTTPRDLQALAYLLKRGASLKVVARYLRTELSREEVELLGELVRGARELVLGGGVRVKVAKATRETYMGDAAHLAHSIMEMEDTDAVVILLMMDDKVVIIGRSHAPEIDMSEVMAAFGGGGHPTAASATVKEVPLEILEERVVGALERSVKPLKTARDVMTSPVVTIGTSECVKDAETRFTKYSVNALPVVRNGKFMGVLTRESVEKALFHGFGKSRVIDFTSTDAMTVQAETPIREAEAIMVERHQRFMPVVGNGKVVGAITRTDLLRSLYEDYLRRSRITGSDDQKDVQARIQKNVSSQLKSRLPEEVHSMLKLAGEVALELGFSAYMVGGSVRDLLRGKENLDIDLVVEGDAIVFSRELGRRLGAHVSTHERFVTASVKTDLMKLDVATARTEYYESPAALPKVETSSIKKDLYRRDFTINSLAVKLNPDGFGRLVDFFGAQRDLKERTIRVLHNLSFVEDPTRALRAVRFSERFGFKISKHTENLIKSTLKMDLFDRLTGTRLYEELRLLFEETDPAKSTRRLDSYGLLSVIHPAITLDAELDALLVSLEDTIKWFGLSFMEEEPPQRAEAFITALIAPLKEPDREAALKRLSFTDKAAQRVLGRIRHASRILDSLPAEGPVEIYDALSPYDVETAILAMALTADKSRLRDITRYLLKLRKVRPLLDGNDLKRLGVAPGKVYSEIFRAVLNEKLKGSLTGRDDEELFVKDYLSSSTSSMS